MIYIYNRINSGNMKWIFFVWDNIPESLRLKIVNIYLVGGIPTPLKNMSSSVGILLFPIDMEK